LKQGINETISGSDNKFYIVSSSAKYSPEQFTSEDLNLLAAKIGLTSMNKDQLRGMRNYFL
jgi:hypothetical protein